MTNAEKLTLAKHACHIRMGVIEGTHSAKCGHPGGSLDIAELLSYLYFVEMNIDPKDPKKADRDRLVLSKGHAGEKPYAHPGRGHLQRGHPNGKDHRRCPCSGKHG